MKTYQLKSEAFQVFRRRWLSRYVPFAALVCGLLGYFYAYPRMETEGSVWYLLFPMALAVGGMYWILRRNLQRHRKAWDEFELYIDGETIGLGERLNPQVAIKREEIETIGESPEGDLYVQAKEDKGQLIVPKDLDGWEEVKALLAGWGEIQPISSDSIQRTNFLVLDPFWRKTLFFSHLIKDGFYLMIQALQACFRLHAPPQALPGAIHIQGLQP
jgi:hypothetical protein